MEAGRRYNVDEAKSQLSRILERVEAGEEVVICRAGRPVAKVIPLRVYGPRTGRGSLRGQIMVMPDFDDLPDDVAGAFGMR